MTNDMWNNLSVGKKKKTLENMIKYFLGVLKSSMFKNIVKNNGIKIQDKKDTWRRA